MGDYCHSFSGCGPDRGALSSRQGMAVATFKSDWLCLPARGPLSDNIEWLVITGVCVVGKGDGTGLFFSGTAACMLPICP